MGSSISMMIPKGFSPKRMLIDQLFASMEKKGIKEFDEFHIAFLEVINNFNAGMLGVHYVAPNRQDVQTCYGKWKEYEPKNRIAALTELLEKSNISKTDNVVLFTGVATPPVAMIGKKAAGNIPTLNFVKLVPDFIFVPSVTLLAVFFMKVARITKEPIDTKNSAGTTSTSTDATKANSSAPNPKDSTASPPPQSEG